MKSHLFLSVLGQRPHGDGVFGHQKRSFSKTLSRADIFENAVFMLSCGRVKTELFENADVTASIYDVPEHAHGSLGITQGYFDCLFSFVKVRTEEFECRSVFVWTGPKLGWSFDHCCVHSNYIKTSLDSDSFLEFSDWVQILCCYFLTITRSKMPKKSFFRTGVP